MLIISRKKDQKIVVADEIEITVLEVGRNRVRFGIKAPRHVPIHTRLKATPEVGEIVEVEHSGSITYVDSSPVAAGPPKRS